VAKLVNGLLKAAGSTTFSPKKKSKSYGTISVDECKITGADNSTSTTVQQTDAPAAVGPSVLPMPVPVPVQQFGGMNLGGGGVPVPPPQRPSFVDYVSGNCDLNMVRI